MKPAACCCQPICCACTGGSCRLQQRATVFNPRQLKLQLHVTELMTLDFRLCPDGKPVLFCFERGAPLSVPHGRLHSKKGPPPGSDYYSVCRRVFLTFPSVLVRSPSKRSLHRLGSRWCAIIEQFVMEFTLNPTLTNETTSACSLTESPR